MHTLVGLPHELTRDVSVGQLLDEVGEESKGRRRRFWVVFAHFTYLFYRWTSIILASLGWIYWPTMGRNMYHPSINRNEVKSS